ncbi:SIS domain-containing protein [Paenibacillus sp. HN-1]|uniref:SIS domain-containing protein n=1 Tax=Paenibacillus TaxID=44249 RepID=UPI001CA97D0E|nr:MULTISPECIES: SIS domain-containing protein [Paenibacillus]MBY9079916.1 SIS domain-containing protein [Paenibacillus sp. CGMCC 1.18879]MBY9084557.1 SIS domain-containing protein [Paenibacillus sinensis]
MTVLADEFVNRIIAQIEVVKAQEQGSIGTAAEWIAEVIAQGGLVHLFGCGHSHLLVEDLFYRAGGMVPVNAIFETSVMLHEGAVKSSKIERMQGYAEHILDNYTVVPGEVMIIISNSGINSLPVEMAQAAKTKGLKVIALCSSSYFTDPPRHPSGVRLAEIADLVIDNHLPHGDALVQIPSSTMKMSSGSTVVGSVILNMVMAGAAEKLVERGIEPPVFVSGNIPGGAERNLGYIEQYRSRIKHL